MDMKKIMENAVFAIAILLIFSRFVSIVADIPFPVNVVASHSMEPVLHKGDVVIWIPCTTKDVRKGDIIVFRSIYGEQVIHRAIKIEKRGIITKGDANKYTDQSGPHFPEPPIGKNLYGKAIMIGSHPLKIPYVGYTWLISQQIMHEIAKPATWGRPQPAIHFLVFLPMIIFFAIFLLMLVLWLPNGNGLDLIFGIEKVGARKMFSYLLAMFIPFLLFSSMLSYDEVNIEKEKNIPVFNPSFLSVKAIAFLPNKQAKTLLLQSGEEKLLPVESKGRVYIYSSPYWVLFPDSLIKNLYGNSVVCLVTLSILSAIILSIVSLFILSIISYLMDGMAVIGVAASTRFMYAGKKFLRFYGVTDFIKKFRMGKSIWIVKNRASRIWLLYLAFIPLLFDGIIHLFFLSLIAALTMAFVAYALKCRTKNEVMFLSMVQSMLFSISFTTKLAVQNHYQNSLIIIQFISIASIIFLMVFLIASLTMFFIMKTIHLARIRFDPVALTEVVDI